MGKRKLPAIDYDKEEAKVDEESLEDLNLGKRAYLAKDPELKDRYKALKEAKYDPNKIKKFVLNKYDITITDISSTILSSLLKTFTGEMVETARELMTEDKLNGPIQPKYFKKALLKVSKNLQSDLFINQGLF